MSTSKFLLRTCSTVVRHCKPTRVIGSGTRYNRSFSVAPRAEDMNNMDVILDKYTAPKNSSSSSTPTTEGRARLPNDVHDRNNLYAEEEERTMAGVTASVRHNWTREEIAAIYNLPFHELMYRAATVHRMYWDPSEVQQCTLLSIKTGGCTEDCSYCSQSTRHKTFVSPHRQ